MSTIAIIEDNASNMKLLKSVLERAGYKTLTAEDGKAGVRLVRTQMPDLVLMDIHMPEADGLSATRQLKADLITRSIPIIAVTARAMEEDRDIIMEAGCNGYTSKPYRYKEILALIEEALAHQNV